MRKISIIPTHLSLLCSLPQSTSHSGRLVRFLLKILNTLNNWTFWIVSLVKFLLQNKHNIFYTFSIVWCDWFLPFLSHSFELLSLIDFYSLLAQCVLKRPMTNHGHSIPLNSTDSSLTPRWSVISVDLRWLFDHPGATFILDDLVSSCFELVGFNDNLECGQLSVPFLYFSFGSQWKSW